MFAWLKLWRKIRRLSGPVRWWLVAGCWLLALIDLIVFSITIR
jgi:hypothetical protein